MIERNPVVTDVYMDMVDDHMPMTEAANMLNDAGM